MNFDRSQAMRSAERHVVNGKLRLAINEYKRIVEHDPRDFVTLNMLGDLYAKDSDKNEAVNCYTRVAEHYSSQGFSQKAIAVYNKIARIQPGSLEVSEKLAELYKVKGSVSEAKSHYTTLAEHYQSKGRTIEALAIWKQIALLDQNNTEVYPKLAASFLEEGHLDEAADAFAEAGKRFEQCGMTVESLAAYNKALEIKPTCLLALSRLASVHSSSGDSDDGLAAVLNALKNDPTNRDVLSLLVDCHLDRGNTAEAEALISELVQKEPTNFAKFTDLARIHLENGDTDAVARIVGLTSEHLLANGRAEEFDGWIARILERDAGHLAGLRLRARYCSWQRDEASLQQVLEEIAALAKESGSVDDERYALSQLVMIAPHATAYGDRLHQINEQYGFVENPFDETILKETFANETLIDDENGAGNFAMFSGDVRVDVGPDPEVVPHVIERNDFTAEDVTRIKAASVASEDSDAAVPETETDPVAKEIESIRFYIENEYADLAEKALSEARATFGDLPQFNELADLLVSIGDKYAGEDPQEIVIEAVETGRGDGPRTLDLDEIRSEFGLEGSDAADDDDYDTHYQLAIAYQEMGLMEDAIKEYQDAINQVSPNDGTRRFFQCANLLGHCFMEKGMANLALRWFNRALETPRLNDDEKQALWYELAGAFEASGDTENAARYFEQVYAENVDFRDVGTRIRNLTVSR